MAACDALPGPPRPVCAHVASLEGVRPELYLVVRGATPEGGEPAQVRCFGRARCELRAYPQAAGCHPRPRPG